ncbi:hypothetical protein FHX75_111818 [Micromonospora palomenae]|uniref:Uncharacterized protein n=1 Tax=Micromonospora palomenae TaxID=1461247 RepID=A0A561WXX2_9ACTN|nr:hypothetical protein FHX75_111818 [Micromonospora palomenae]
MSERSERIVRYRPADGAAHRPIPGARRVDGAGRAGAAGARTVRRSGVPA